MAKLSEDSEKYAKLARYKPVVFGWEAGFTDLTEDLHNMWIKKFMYSKHDITLQAHRGSYKTTCLSIAIALLLVTRPSLEIIFLRKTDGDVKEIITQVAKIIRSDMVQGMVYEMYGVDLETTTESVYEVDTNLNQSSSGASQLIGIGTSASITGKHADIVITDDIVNVDDRTSPAARSRTRDVYQELQNIKNRSGRIVNTGTPWHREDAFQLMPSIERYDCYTTGLMSREHINQLKQTMDRALFAANYELRHIASDDVLFPEPVIDDGTHTDKIYHGLCHIDAAYYGADYSAFTVLNEHDGTLYVYGELSDKHIDDALPQFEMSRSRYLAGTLYNERNADKGYLARVIEKPVKTYHERMNKHIKITTYLKSRWQDVIFIKDTDPDYINQIVEYTENAQHDDAPDSLASLIREQQKGNKRVNLFSEGL